MNLAENRYDFTDSSGYKTIKVDDDGMIVVTEKMNFSTFSETHSKDRNGGGNMDNYITRPEFEEHKRHLDTRFDGITKDITIAKNDVLTKIDETKKSDKRWFIGLAWTTGVTLLGVIVAIVGLILQITEVI